MPTLHYLMLTLECTSVHILMTREYNETNKVGVSDKWWF